MILVGSTELEGVAETSREATFASNETDGVLKGDCFGEGEDGVISDVYGK